MKKKLLVLCVFCVLLVLKMNACSCAVVGSVEKVMPKTDGVFAGEIISKQLVNVQDSMIMKMYPDDSLNYNKVPYVQHLVMYEMKVLSTYKGGGTSEVIKIYTDKGIGACGFPFEIGERYIVYGTKEQNPSRPVKDNSYPSGENIFWTSICTRTTYLNQTEIAAIEKCLDKK